MRFSVDGARLGEGGKGEGRGGVEEWKPLRGKKPGGAQAVLAKRFAPPSWQPTCKKHFFIFFF